MYITHKLDDYTKQAMWHVHGKSCFYCREALLYKNIQVDHVIPVKVFIDYEKEIIGKYSLDIDFDFNSLDNFVPACQSCNSSRKHDKEISNGIPLWLNTCKARKEDILKKAKQIKESLSLDLPDQYRDFFVTSPDFLLVGLEIERIRKIDIELYKILAFHPDYWSLELTDPKDPYSKVQIHNLKQYEEWSTKGYYGLTTPDIAMSSICEACIAFFRCFENAVYIENKVSLVEYFPKLPASLLHVIGPEEGSDFKDFTTIEDYLTHHPNISAVNDNSNIILTIEYPEFNEREIYYIKEVLQADFSGWGNHEAILFIHYQSAGTLNYTFSVLVSEKNRNWVIVNI